MCNIKQYKDFNELPEDIKIKYKIKSGRGNNKRSQQSFVNFVNLLNINGHTLVGDYINNRTKTLIDYNCGHGIREVTYDSYRDHQKCLLCSREEASERTKKHFQNMSSEQRNDFKAKMKEVNQKEWDRRKQDEQFMQDFRNKITQGMDNMSEKNKQDRKDNISKTWANKTEEEKKQFYLEHGGENSTNWKGTAAITDYCRNLVRKKDILRKNNYTCQLTGQVGCKLAIHHIYSFNLVIQDAHNINNIQIKKSIDLYSKEELDLITDYIIKWHEDTNNYIVIAEDLHKQFHKLYGNGNNTREQWQEFLNMLANKE